MTKSAACCGPKDSLALAANLLWRNDCGCVPVVDDDGRVQGMITDRDICMAALTTGKVLADLVVDDAMSKDVVSIGPDESLHEAELVMRSRGVRRLPVVDARRRVLGMLCCNDLLRWVDDGGADGATAQDAVHLVRTLAIIGKPRTSVQEPQPVAASKSESSVQRATPQPKDESMLLAPSRREGRRTPRQTH